MCRHDEIDCPTLVIQDYIVGGCIPKSEEPNDGRTSNLRHAD